MDVSSALSELWELFGELSEQLAQGGQELSVVIQNNPQFWTWLTVWLGLVWICVRWSNKVADTKERRIFEAAESRLSHLIQEIRGETVPPNAAAPEQLVGGCAGIEGRC